MGNFTVLNVKDDFGAIGNDDHDDSGAIQDALDFAASLAEHGSKLRGAIVFFPPGVYKVDKGIVIPRIYYGTIILRGSGMWASIIIASNPDFPTNVPVIGFKDTPGNPTGYEISDLLITRTTIGAALRHNSTGDQQRLTSCTFRNLKLDSIVNTIVDKVSEDGTIVYASENTLDIVGGLHSIFENIIISGGNSCMVLRNSSHCILTNIHQVGNNMGISHNAVRIISGGSHKLTEIRSEAIDGATLTLEQCSSTVIDSVYNEGKQTKYVVKMEGSQKTPTQDIIISHLGIAQPLHFEDGHPKYGLYINGFTRNVRILSGTTNYWHDKTNDKPIPGNNIYIESGAQHISIDNMHFFDNIGEYRFDNGPSAILNIERGATDIKVKVIDWNSLGGTSDKKYKLWERSVGTVGVLVPSPYNAKVGHVQTYEVMRTGPGGAINMLIQGTRQPSAPLNEVFPSEGRRLTLIGTGAGSSLDSGGNIKFANEQNNWIGSVKNIIDLVYDGSFWREISRSET